MSAKLPNWRPAHNSTPGKFLLARRVIEAGARCVTLAFTRWPFGRMLQGDYNWDWHKDNFNEARGALPLIDIGMSALIGDLEERGLLDEVAVVAWGEFGRTPKINGNAGRDQTGRVLGSSPQRVVEPITWPVRMPPPASSAPPTFGQCLDRLIASLRSAATCRRFGIMLGVRRALGRPSNCHVQLVLKR